MFPPLGRLVIYTKKIDEMAAFYCRHFGYTRHDREGDRIVELRGPGIPMMLHQAGARQKEGQPLVKLVFDTPNVAAFCEDAAANGLEFSKEHKADGYTFANAKDPGGNSIQVSSRAFAS